MTQAAELFNKAKMYKEELGWLQKKMELKGGAPSEFDFYKLTSTAYLAKDYAQTMAIAQKYIAAFPDKPHPYQYNVYAAKALDSTTNPGIALAALQQQNAYLYKDSTTNKKKIVSNYYYIMGYYNDKLKDYQKALDICDTILTLIPNDPEMMKIKDYIKGNMSKPAPTKPGNKPTSSAGTAVTSNRNSAGSPK